MDELQRTARGQLHLVAVVSDLWPSRSLLPAKELNWRKEMRIQRQPDYSVHLMVVGVVALIIALVLS